MKEINQHYDNVILEKVNMFIKNMLQLSFHSLNSQQQNKVIHFVIFFDYFYSKSSLQQFYNDEENISP